MADKEISELTNYTPPIDVDVVPIVDSTTGTTKKLTWANLKATIKTYYDSLVTTLTNKTINADNNTITNIGDEELKAGINADKISSGSVSNTEFDYINGVTSAIQTQLDNKEPKRGSDDNYVTDAEKTVIGNTSGVNTGDQDLSGLALKSNVLELDNTDAFTPDTDYEPATKKYVDDNAGGTPEGTAIKSTGETGATKFLREDGDGTCSWQNIPGGGDMLKSTYDPANINEQLVGLTATQTLTNKTIDGDNNAITNVASDDVNLNTMSGVSKTLTDYMNTIQSSGYISGGDFTDNGDGTAKVSAGAGFIKTTNAVGGSSLGITWAENSSLTMIANSTNYIYVDYNAGTPIVKTSTTQPTDFRTIIHLGKIYRNGSNVLHLFKAGSYIPEHTISNIGRWVAQFGEVALTSGGLVAETGARYITVSAATLFGGIVKTTTSAIDTSGTDTFAQFYTDGAGGWNEADISQINNTQYDNGGTLTNLSNNRHRTDFAYLDNDGHLYIILGTNNDYFLSDAQAVQPPSSVPSIISNFSTLIAKIIVKEGETNLIEVDNLEKGATFSSSGIIVHNETTGIQGGTADEYYHLTDAEHTIVGNTSGVNTGDQDLSSYATKTGTETLTNKRITPRVGTVASASTITPTGDSSDLYTVTALAVNTTISAPSGTPTNGQKLMLRIKDDGTSRTLTWNAIYNVVGVTLPTSTTAGKTHYIGCVYNSANSKWDVLAVGKES